MSLVWTPKKGLRRRWRLALDPLPWTAALLVAAAGLSLAFTLGRLAGLKQPALPQAAGVTQKRMEDPSKGMRTNDQIVGGQTAPGRLIGEPPDVITPLNVRDPSALVMPPSGLDQGTAAPPPNARSKKPKSVDWRLPQDFHF